MVDLSIIVAVTFGFFTHSAIYLWPINRDVAQKIFFLIFASAALALVTCKECDSVQVYLGWSTMLFFVFYFATFREEIMPLCNEYSLILFTIIFWYTFLQIEKNIYLNYFGIFAALVTIGILFQLYSKKIPKKFVKLFFYLWQLTVIVWLFFFLFDPSYVFLENLDLFNAFVFGMLMYFLAIHLFPIVLIFSALPVSYILARQKIYIWDRPIIEIMDKKYSSEQLSVLSGLLLITTLIMVLGLNFYFKFITDSVLINLFFIFLMGNNALSKLKKPGQKIDLTI